MGYSAPLDRSHDRPQSTMRQQKKNYRTKNDAAGAAARCNQLRFDYLQREQQEHGKDDTNDGLRMAAINRTVMKSKPDEARFTTSAVMLLVARTSSSSSLGYVRTHRKEQFYPHSMTYRCAACVVTATITNRQKHTSSTSYRRTEHKHTHTQAQAIRQTESHIRNKCVVWNGYAQRTADSLHTRKWRIDSHTRYASIYIVYVFLLRLTFQILMMSLYCTLDERQTSFSHTLSFDFIHIFINGDKKIRQSI